MPQRRYKKKGGGGGGNRNNYHRSGVRQNYAEPIKENEQFEKYYNQLGLLAEDEKAQFWETMRRELPNSFRFAGSKGHALAVKQLLIDRYIPEITSVSYNGENVSPPEPVSWYPEELAWQMTTPKAVVRKFPPFASFQKFLVSETSVGNISRQEVVSMIPPLLLDVRPHMTVLDLCAAPGSKAAQLIELIHAGEEARVRQVIRKIAADDGREVSPDGVVIETEKRELVSMEDGAQYGESEPNLADDGRATGLLIANDVDYKRAQMLVHQMKRLNSPNIIITNHDASLFPSIKLTTEPGKPYRYLKFDRILADVPCSGDGTCRKNLGIWRDWTPGNALGLHILQVRILIRSLQLLKVGGRMVYSTCSMNPVENEAVIASAIDRCGGTSKVRIVDCSSSLPALKRRAGLRKWSVIDKSGKTWDSWADVEKAKTETGSSSAEKLSEGMFPPEEPDGSERIPLERCIRILSHQQDTGCFFIVVLEKLSDIRARPESEAKKTKKETGEAGEPTVAASKEAEAHPAAKSASVEDGKAETSNGMPDADKTQSKPGKRELEDSTAAEVPPKRQMTENGMTETEGKFTDTSTNTDHNISTESTQPTRLSITSNKKRDNNHPFEEPFKYLPPTHPELLTISAFYGLSPRFPRTRFMVRNATGEPVKTIYYTSALAREILTENEGKGIRFVHCGVKMFMKQDVQGRDACRWRIQSEGMPIVEAWVDSGEGKRVVRLRSRSTLQKLLKEMFPRVSGEGWRELGEIGERMRDVGMGCCVLRVEPSGGEDGFRERMILPLWRGVSSLNLMLPKEERKAMLLRLYNDTSDLIDNSQDRRNQAAAAGIITNNTDTTTDNNNTSNNSNNNDNDTTLQNPTTDLPKNTDALKGDDAAAAAATTVNPTKTENAPFAAPTEDLNGASTETNVADDVEMMETEDVS